MANPTPATTVTPVERTGTGFSITGLIALAIPLLYTLYATVSSVSVASQDDAKALVTNAVIITLVAAVLGLVGLVLGGLGLMRGARMGRGLTVGMSGFTLITSLLFLFLTLIPRANALTTLNDKTAPFARSIQTNCKNQLDNAKALLKTARDQTQAAATNDAAFAQVMITQVGILQSNASDLQNAATLVKGLTAPDSKYQMIVTSCATDLQGQAGFLVSESAIPLPPPYNALAKSVSATTLMKTAAAIVSGKGPIPAPPAGTFQPLIIAALTQAINATDAPLTKAGDQLKQDITDTLTNNLAPFKVGFEIK